LNTGWKKKCLTAAMILSLLAAGAPVLAVPAAAASALGVIEGESYDSGTGTTKASGGNANGTGYVGGIDNNDAIVFNNVDFGSGAAYVQARVTSPHSGGKIEFRLGSTSGTLIATLDVPKTGGWGQGPGGAAWMHSWTTASAPVSGASGVHNLVLVFKGGASPAFELDWFRFGTNAAGRTFYVATNGSDSNDGLSASAPMKTLDLAAAKLLPGDTLLIRGGTYAQRINTSSTNSGTADRRVTIKNYPGETVILDGASLSFNQFWGLVQDEGNYTTWDGLTIRNSPGMGISTNGDYNVWQNLKIDTTVQGGIVAFKSIGSKVLNNEITNTCRVNAGLGDGGGWPSAINFKESGDFEFRGNYVHDNYGEGIISYMRAYNGKIIGNRVKDNYSVGIYLDNAVDTVVENNLVWETETSYIARSATGWRTIGSGIGLADEDYSSQDSSYSCSNPGFVPGQRNTIRNNIIIGSRKGIDFQALYIPCAGVKMTTIVNNTVVNTWEEAIHFQATGSSLNHAGSTIRNNIFVSRGNPSTDNYLKFVATLKMRNDTIVENNLFYKPGFTSTSPDLFLTHQTADTWNPMTFDTFNAQTNIAGNVWGDPQLAALGSLTGDVAANHKLTAGSTSAINKGTSAGAPAADYFGGPRPVNGAYDIGAHEFAGSVNPGDTTAPTAPANLASSGKTSASVSLTWSASTDNVGVTGYDVYRGTILCGTASSTSFTCTGLSPGTAYTFTVRAKDAAGNVSAASGALTVTTNAAVPSLLLDNFDNNPAWPGSNDLGKWASANSFVNGAGAIDAGALKLQYANSGWLGTDVQQNIGSFTKMMVRIKGAAGGEQGHFNVSLGGVTKSFAAFSGDTITTVYKDIAIDLAANGVSRTSPGQLQLSFWNGQSGTLWIDEIRFE